MSNVVRGNGGLGAREITPFQVLISRNQGSATMAAAPAIAASLFPKATPARLTAVRSSIGALPPPPRFTRRRNYLRRKLLKTLTKPSPETLTLPAEGHEIDVREFDFQAPRDPEARDFESTDAVEESEASSSDAKAPEFVQVSVSEASGSASGSVSARTVVRFGAYFVGIFVLQAVVRALLKGSDDSSDDKRRRQRSNGEELGLNGNGNPFREKLEMKDGALLYVNEAELEAKIAEIRMMAKEAKEREKKNAEDGGFGSSDEEDDSDHEAEDGGSPARSGIEREIDGRLTRVRRGLDTARENSQVMNVNFLNKPKPEDQGKGKKNVSGEKEEDKTLIFEKKFKFRNGDSSKPREKPKGFQGYDRTARNGSINGKDNGVPSKAPRVDMGSSGESGDLKREGSKIVDVNDARKTTEILIQDQAPMKESGVDLKKEIEKNAEQQKGNVQDATVEQSVDKVTRLTMSESLDSRTTVDEGGKTKTSGNDAVPRTSGRSKARKVGSTPSTSRGDSKEADDSSDLWWLNLPYLLAIAMEQGYEDEGERGFYTLKVVSDDPSQTLTTYTVLFEDRVDAQNFCYLLESFFEELEDISVFVIPMPMKELNDAVKSQARKVIVVRKGQLQLYAGQPLDEVETTLRSMIK